MPPPGLQKVQMYLRPGVTLCFDLLTPKVNTFMSLPHELLVTLDSKIGSFVSKISGSQTCSYLLIDKFPVDNLW